MYIIYILILFLSYILFLDVYNKYYVKFIVVVSNDNNNILKIQKPNLMHNGNSISLSLWDTAGLIWGLKKFDFYI